MQDHRPTRFVVVVPHALNANIIFNMVDHFDCHDVILPSNYCGTRETTINRYDLLTFT
ncbi:hypothetical protein HanXRQr2_Chr06g0261171 [Helianthus annuus]|uniref:Uncharacterized protein n=1 Tax=Helianthus annuus TaxID=4232 RepID=A0A9K3NJ78_HELAN|nr:hypothetical protein HanXRQr2_Chr06g0261171 [Helianthus annuus]